MWSSIRRRPRSRCVFEAYSDGYTSTAHSGSGTHTITDRCVASIHSNGVTDSMTVFVASDGSAYWCVNMRNDGVASGGNATRVSRGRPLE